MREAWGHFFLRVEVTDCIFPRRNTSSNIQFADDISSYMMMVMVQYVSIHHYHLFMIFHQVWWCSWWWWCLCSIHNTSITCAACRLHGSWPDPGPHKPLAPLIIMVIRWKLCCWWWWRWCWWWWWWWWWCWWQRWRELLLHRPAFYILGADLSRMHCIVMKMMVIIMTVLMMMRRRRLL